MYLGFSKDVSVDGLSKGESGRRYGQKDKEEMREKVKKGFF